MILVAGGSGRLGSLVVAGLEVRGLPVRSLSHHHDGDLRGITEETLDGATVVVSAVTGFPSQSPRRVDRDGNVALVDAAARAGADVVLVSVLGAAADSGMELFRAKHAAEEHLRRSRASWTIVRPDAFEETWVEILERSAGRRHRPVVLGRGDTALAWVPVQSVADAVVRAVGDPTTRGQVIDVRGPRPRTLDQLGRQVMSAHGWAGEPRHVPRAVLRVVSRGPGRVGRVADAALRMDGARPTVRRASGRSGGGPG